MKAETVSYTALAMAAIVAVAGVGGEIIGRQVGPTTQVAQQADDRTAVGTANETEMGSKSALGVRRAEEQAERTFAGSADMNTAGSISGRVFRDMNADGYLGEKEPGFHRIEVVLKDRNGKIVQAVATNGLGQFSFLNVPMGEYFVSVNEAGLPAAFDAVSFDDGLWGQDLAVQNPAGTRVLLGQGAPEATWLNFGYELVR